jgi:hypothetical protein
LSEMPPTPEVVALATLQFHRGGLFDGRPVDHLVHLVRRTATYGTPGPTLCGIDRFAKDSAGWSVGGGFYGQHKVVACPSCLEGALADFVPIPIEGVTPFRRAFMEALNG